MQLRRLASSLYTSSKVPVAAAAYGASQVGKSLFMGQVLRPQSENYCPIGGDETLGEPAYYKNLSFDNDLNPQCGSQEATALVTRFTTKDRIGAGVSPQYPVMVRALTRAEWLRVLARGFHAECKTPADDLAAGRAGRRSSRTSHASIPTSRSIASGGWTSWTPSPTCGTSIAAASRRPRR